MRPTSTADVASAWLPHLCARRRLVLCIPHDRCDASAPVARVQAIYKDKEKIAQQIRDNMPGYKTFTEFEYGFKIRDKEKPDAWHEPDNIVLLPPEDEIPSNPVEGFKSSLGRLFGGDQKK